MRHYSDYFHVKEDYCPNMTREEINQTPERWLDFCPHPEFEEICNTILSVLSSGAKSVWITGNFGTGKSNASLVIQKLFMDDEKRVRQWFEQEKQGFSDQENLKKTLFARRADGTLVVYDFNASGVGANSGLLVRLEKGIIAALHEHGMTVPAMSNLEILIDRVRREGENFFKTRDSIQDQLIYLNENITTADQLAEALKQDTIASLLLSEVETVLHQDYIYLDFDVPMFRKWVKAILDVNRLHSIVYLFDEFHPFIEANSSQLKTFENVTETPGINRFFLVPVTHMDIQQYWAEGSESAKKANDRFYFRKLQMPNDTAFRLARHAMIDNPNPDIAAEWEKAKGDLWDSISYVVNQFNAADDPGRQRFYDILPIHPMAAFLLKHLSESAKSNQRSLFEYLKGGADGTEFQDFIHQGGPEIASKQFLTVDYLWHYFMVRSDLGVDREITNISLLYQQIKERSFQNQAKDAPELRVLKAALLFCLMDRLTPGGHIRLRPTVENVVLSFRGDGTITDPEGIVETLQSKHCFSVSNGQISLFSMSTVKPEDVEKYRPQFYELLHERTQAMLEEKTKNDRQYSSGRFDIRVSDEGHTTLTNITAATRDKYSSGLAKDDGSVCLWFVIARDHEEQLAIPQRISNMLNQLRDHRMIMFTFPQHSFCHSNKNLWSEYIRQYAQYVAENDKTVKRQIRDEERHNGTLDKIEAEWFDELKRNNTLIRVHRIKNDLSEYVASIIPQRSEKERLQDEARTEGETRFFLAKINISFNSNANYYSFEIPSLGFSHSQTIIEDYVWNRIKSELIGEAGGWGLVKLGYMPPEGNKKNGRFTLLDFKNFCPYKVSLDDFREARSHFETEEWMNILLGAIDYNPDGFMRKGWIDRDVWRAKHTMLTRLLPFIQPRVNLIELAPQQTGKSYMFGKISKYGWLLTGGQVSRTMLFLDRRSGARAKGLVTCNDFIAVDEIKSISFSNDQEMAGILKGYMEDGYATVGGTRVDGEAGIIFLGNIAYENMDSDKDMIGEINPIFRDSALLQRIHGFIPGHYVPSLSPNMYINDWALNSEYFTEIMHLLRSTSETMKYRGMVEELVDVSSATGNTSGREKEAVFRLCTAYLKLFFPHANSDLIHTLKFKQEFDWYCLTPAKTMQETVLSRIRSAPAIPIKRSVGWKLGAALEKAAVKPSPMCSSFWLASAPGARRTASPSLSKR